MVTASHDVRVVLPFTKLSHLVPFCKRRVDFEYDLTTTEDPEADKRPPKLTVFALGEKFSKRIEHAPSFFFQA